MLPSPRAVAERRTLDDRARFSLDHLLIESPAIAGEVDTVESRTREARPLHSLVKALRSVPTLAPFDQRTLLTIAGDSANLFWPAGAVVFERGSAADGLYVVLSGGVRILGDAGEELNVLGPGEYFGEFSLLLGTDHQNDVHAVEDSELLVVPRELVDELLSAHPEVAERIRQEAEERRAANLRALTS